MSNESMSDSLPIESTESQPTVFTVTQLTTGVQNLLGMVFSDVRVTGEITNLSRTAAGHCYFSLKDETAQLSAVIWNSTRRRCPVELRDGLEVVCRGKIDVYPPRGSYQLIVNSLEQTGIGSLEQAFLKLKQKLAAEGLFAPEHKPPLPCTIRRVGVVTSPSGAAIHDFLQVLRRRFSGLDVIVYPAPVQGKGAAAKLADGVAFFNRYAGRLGIDCIVITRGGGSMEDLWEFNEEVLIRAIYDSELPTISAVGHEIDVTLCDLVASRRALTPSEAAEIVSPDSSDLKTRLKHTQQRLRFAMDAQCQRLESALQRYETHPVFRFPYRTWERCTQQTDLLESALRQTLARRLERETQNMGRLAAQLQTLSPVNVLARGYSLTKSEASGQLVRNVVECAVGERLVTQLQHGRVVSRIEELQNDE